MAVVGTVGSGKSSLLSALLGEMVRFEGEANGRGKVAYVPQQAWMRNTSLKENVLFGKKFKPDIYNKVGGQSYKAFTSVNQDYKVVLTSKLILFTTLGM